MILGQDGNSFSKPKCNECEEHHSGDGSRFFVCLDCLEKAATDEPKSTIEEEAKQQANSLNRYAGKSIDYFIRKIKLTHEYVWLYGCEPPDGYVDELMARSKQ